jgi:hypothetical protein
MHIYFKIQYHFKDIWFEPIVLHPCMVKKDEPNLFFLTSMATANAYICAKDTPNLSRDDT